jgi:hypothetical protein
VQYTAQAGDAQQFDALMKRLQHFKIDRKYTRDEMNER